MKKILPNKLFMTWLSLCSISRVWPTKNPEEFCNITDYHSWKSYDWDTIDKLNEEELVVDKHGNKSLWITEAGVQKAREILEQYGMGDWKAD